MRLTQREDGSTVAREVPPVTDQVRGSETDSRLAHNQEIAGSTPVLASNRLGRDCGHASCFGCYAVGESFKVQATGATRRVLFPWQEGLAGPAPKPTGARFRLDKDGHDEAEVRCLGCSRTFWSLAPLMLQDARSMSDARQGQHPVA